MVPTSQDQAIPASSLYGNHLGSCLAKHPWKPLVLPSMAATALGSMRKQLDDPCTPQMIIRGIEFHVGNLKVNDTRPHPQGHHTVISGCRSCDSTKEGHPLWTRESGKDLLGKIIHDLELRQKDNCVTIECHAGVFSIKPSK